MIEHQSIKKWFALITSALLYPLPFFFPQEFFWVSFIYLVPLFYISILQKLSRKEGYIWGLIALAGHEAGIFYGIFHMAVGAFWARLLPILFLIFFRAIFPAIWFFITQASIRFGKMHTVTGQLVIWSLTAWWYQLWMDQYHLWVFGVPEGYILLNPLIPFAAHPQLLYLLPTLGSFLLLYLIACSAQITYALLSKNGHAWICAGLMLLPWLSGFVFQKDSVCPTWLEKIAVMQQKFSTTHESSAITLLQKQCVLLLQQYPQVSCIICPETCIYEENLTYHLPTYAHACTYQLIGGFGFDEKHRNTAYSLHNNTIHSFDKRHAMPLTERTPTWANIPLIHDLYFATRPQIIPSRNVRPIWRIGDQTVTPYICSELFFNAHSDDAYPGIMILALCNDAWAPDSVKYLMYLGAQYRAQEWQRDILYVSYGYAALIKHDGTICPVQAHCCASDSKK